jgi:hypothetical protein
MLEKAIGMNGASRAAYYRLALAYRELNRPERAREMLVKVRGINARERGERTLSHSSPEDH